MNIQFKKGVLELCVLSLLAKRDRYGYDVSESLSKHIDISDGTVYPILRKLKSDGFVTTYLVEESGGPPRKYYSLTDLGQEEFMQTRDEWLNFAETIKKLIKGELNDD
ncbi:MAG: PadR family transcriptional regulator [Oscillospiraceae bacterium]|nr:PadR family transcriptional regulator [Oscillospiraceae bacterium]